MSYTKHTWSARQGTGLNRFSDQNGDYWELTPAPTSITQQGTPFSADWLNNIENGLDFVSNPVELANGSDLNDYPDGIFCQMISQNTSNMTNIPQKRGFYMWAYKSGLYGFQRILFYAIKKEYVRSLIGGTWSDWIPMDGIEEKGTSGIWEYVKYSDGKAEAWGVTDITPASPSSLSGFYYKYTSGINLPFTFVSLNFFAPTISKTVGGAAFGEGNLTLPVSNATAVQVLTMQTNSSGSTHTINLYVRGTWK